MIKISRGKKYLIIYIITISIIAVVNYIISNTHIKNTIDKIDTLELLKISVMIGVVFLLLYMNDGSSDTKKYSKKKKK